MDELKMSIEEMISMLDGAAGRLIVASMENTTIKEAMEMVTNVSISLGEWVTDGLPQNRWIPVTERLPDVPGHVLVWDNTAKIRKILWFHDCNGWGVEDKHPKRYFGNASDQRRYTHWMPLPEPPEGGTENAVGTGL